MLGVLYFDPDCGFCAKVANFLGILRLNVRISPGFATSYFFDNVDIDRFSSEIAFVFDDGPVVYGAQAFGSILKTSDFKVIKILGKFILSKAGQGVSQIIYLFISDMRYRLPGSSCEIKRVDNE